MARSGEKGLKVRFTMAISTMLLAGCATAQNAEARECRVEGAQSAIGKPAATGTIEGIRKRSGAKTVRVVRPGEMVTMDYRADRVTVTVDERQTIAKVACG
jgi:uncharacterized lipoprotein YajG